MSQYSMLDFMISSPLRFSATPMSMRVTTPATPVKPQRSAFKRTHEQMHNPFLAWSSQGTQDEADHPMRITPEPLTPVAQAVRWERMEGMSPILRLTPLQQVRVTPLINGFAGAQKMEWEEREEWEGWMQQLDQEQEAKGRGAQNAGKDTLLPLLKVAAHNEEGLLMTTCGRSDLATMQVDGELCRRIALPQVEAQACMPHVEPNKSSGLGVQEVAEVTAAKDVVEISSDEEEEEGEEGEEEEEEGGDGYQMRRNMFRGAPSWFGSGTYVPSQRSEMSDM